MSEKKAERRSRKRVPANLPVVLSTTQKIKAEGVTRDLSTSGIFLYTKSDIAEGTDLEMVLMFPPELTQGEKRWVCCQVAVVRVEKGDEKTGFGVAARIRNMEVLPEIAP